MKKLILAFIVMLLVFGCIGIPGQQVNVPLGNITVPKAPNVTVDNGTISVKTCDANYSVSSIVSTKLSGTQVLSVTANCASNKTIAVYVDDAISGQSVVPGESAILNFNIIATTEGMHKVEVKSDGQVVGSKSFNVTPIGYFNTVGTENDPVSINHVKALAFDIDSPISVKRVGAYMWRLESMTIGSNIIAEIRKDSNGQPGDSVATSTLPIKVTTLTPNWIYFPTDTQLAKGRYWLVFSVSKDNEYVNIKYTTNDKLKPGNANHLKMDLTKNEDLQIWEQTTWDPLSFDRSYSFIVSATSS